MVELLTPNSFPLNLWNIIPCWYASHTIIFLLVLMVSSNSSLPFAASLGLSTILAFSVISVLLATINLWHPWKMSNFRTPFLPFFLSVRMGPDWTRLLPLPPCSRPWMLKHRLPTSPSSPHLFWYSCKKLYWKESEVQTMQCGNLQRFTTFNLQRFNQLF